MGAHYSRLISACAVSACGAAPAPRPPPPVAPPPAPRVVHHLADPDLAPREPKKLLAIDWANTRLADDAAALALWQQIAPTGDDWQLKVDEIPGDLPVAHQLAIALLHDGNFACPALPAAPCSKAPPEVAPAAATATLADPCLRRLLALWAIDELDASELPGVRDALHAIAALPPPESQLIDAAIRAWPESDFDDRYALMAAAWQAGQHDLVNGLIGDLDEPHVLAALTQLHAGGALEVLPAELHRAAFFGAIRDGQLAPSARTTAMDELAAEAELTGAHKLDRDLHAALTAAARSIDCEVAAHAARVLDDFGDRSFVPKLPRTSSPAAMMRGLCVLASFERAQRADEPSYFATYVPARGLELVTVTYDPYGDSDPDGDGDDHTTHTATLVPPAEVSVPEIDDLVVAMQHCAGTACRSDDHEFRFTFKPGAGGLLLARLEVAELPPCQSSVIHDP